MDCKTQLTVGSTCKNRQSVGQAERVGGDFIFVLLIHIFFEDFVMIVNLSIFKY
jgi:hypothetical protein